MPGSRHEPDPPKKSKKYIIWEQFLEPISHKSRSCWQHFFRPKMEVILEAIWHQFGVCFGAIFDHFLESRAKVKIWLPPRREHYFQGFQRRKNEVFFDCSRIPILRHCLEQFLDEFGLHFGVRGGSVTAFLGDHFQVCFWNRKRGEFPRHSAALRGIARRPGGMCRAAWGDLGG